MIAGAERAAALLRSTGAGPAVSAFRAPGRINLIGEHVDYNGGLVLPMAIDLACVAVASPATDSSVTVVLSADAAGAASFDLTRATGPESIGSDSKGWTRYASGAAVCAANHVRTAGGTVRNLTIAIASDVPLGGGLSSSASLEVAVAGVVASALGKPLAGMNLAMAAHEAETRYAGVPCGIMDQCASVFGKAGHAVLLDCRDRSVRHVPLPIGNAAILVVDSGVRHELAEGAYAARRRACEEAGAIMGLISLRDAGAVQVHECASLTSEQRRCALHAVSEIERVRLATEELSRATGKSDRDVLAVLGRLLSESHESLRHGYRVSCGELDTIVDSAAAVPGVYGARMTGAGFGGSAIVLVDSGAIEAAVGAIDGAMRAGFGRGAAWRRVQPSAGAGPLNLAG